MQAKNSNKRTVLIITRHNVPNYGSVMQSYATERVICNLGFESATLDYLRSGETLESLIKCHSAGRSLPHKIYCRTVWPMLWKSGERKFRGMREGLLNLSTQCDETNIWDRLPEVDVYLTGSDQVWNAMGDGSVDGAFFGRA